MQLYALDNQQKIVSARQAFKHCDYYCLECQSLVRLRGGMHRQMHFYHLDPDRICSQKAKSMVHLQTQCYLQERLPFGETAQEYRFPEIGRVADVVWHPQRVIFEVQCSPISAEEVSARNRDYARLGFQVIWILHDQRYNHRLLTAAEAVLRDSPHYFTNIDAEGHGMIYDQFDLFTSGRRIEVLDPLPIAVNQLHRSLPTSSNEDTPKFIIDRVRSRRICFVGDLLHCYLSGQALEYLQKSAAAYAKTEKPLVTAGVWMKFWSEYIVRPYVLAMQMLLESCCR